MDVNLMTGQLRRELVLATVGRTTVSIAYSCERLLTASLQSRTQATFGQVGASWKISTEGGHGSVLLVGSLLDPTYSLSLNGASYQLRPASENGSGSGVASYTVLGRPLWRMSLDSQASVWCLTDDTGLNYHFGDRPGIAVEKGAYSRQTGAYEQQSAAYASLLGALRSPSDNPNYANLLCSSVATKLAANGSLALDPKAAGQALVPIRWNISAIEDGAGGGNWFYYGQHVQSVFDLPNAPQRTVGTYLYKIEQVSGNVPIKTVAFTYAAKGQEEPDAYWGFSELPCDPLQQERQLLYLTALTNLRSVSGKTVWECRLTTNVNRERRGFAGLQSYRELDAVDFHAPDGNGNLAHWYNAATFAYYALPDLPSPGDVFALKDMYNPETGAVLGLLKSVKDSNGVLTVYRYADVSAVTRAQILPWEDDIDVTQSSVHLSNRGFYVLNLFNPKSKTYSVVLVQWNGLAFERTTVFQNVKPVDNFLGRDWLVQTNANTIALVSPDGSSFQLFVRGFGPTFVQLQKSDYDALGGNSISGGSVYLDEEHMVAQRTSGGSLLVNHLRFDVSRRQWTLAKALAIPAWSQQTGQSYFVTRAGNFLLVGCAYDAQWSFTAPKPDWPHDPYPISAPLFTFCSVNWANGYAVKTQGDKFYGAQLMQSTFAYPKGEVQAEWAAFLAGTKFGGLNAVTVINNRLVIHYGSSCGFQYDWGTQGHGPLASLAVDEWATAFEVDYATGGVRSVAGGAGPGQPNILNGGSRTLLNNDNVYFGNGGEYPQFYAVPVVAASFVADGQGGGCFTMSFFNMQVELNRESGTHLYVGGTTCVVNVPNAASGVTELYGSLSEVAAGLTNPAAPKYHEVVAVPVAVLAKDAFFLSVTGVIANTWTYKNQTYFDLYYYMDLATGQWHQIHTGSLQNVTNNIKPNPEAERIKNGFDLFNKIFSIVQNAVFAIVDPASLLVTIPLLTANFVIDKVQDLLASYHLNPTVNTTSLMATFNSSSKYVLDGSTVWYRGNGYDKLTALASGESFQLTDTLSSDLVKGNVVVDNKIGGTVTKFAPFYTDASILYTRKLVDDRVLPPRTFLFLNEFVDAFSFADGTVGFVTGREVQCWNQDNSGFVSNLPVPLDNNTPVDQIVSVESVAVLAEAGVTVVLSGRNLFVYSGTTAKDFTAGMPLLSVLDLRLALTNYADFAQSLPTLVSICADFQGSNKLTLTIFGAKNFGKLVLDADFQSVSFDVASVTKWADTFKGVTGALSSVYTRPTKKVVVLVSGSDFYVFGYAGGQPQQKFNTSWFNQKYDAKTDRVFFAKGDIAVWSNEAKAFYLATAHDAAHGDLARTFVVERAEEYSDKDFALNPAPLPTVTTRFIYDTGRAMLDQAAGITFGAVVVEDTVPEKGL